MPSQARGLVKFPVDDLGNSYHFIRAGESLLEAENIWSTNPLFLTNREAALSTVGMEQVEQSLEKLKALSVAPTLIRYSLAASSVDTANIAGRVLRIGRDRLVPEFNFLDPRAVGLWDNFPLSTTQPAIWALDDDEAGPFGTGGRPPPNEDSTPHETLADQAIRLRQLLSVLETQFSGDTILLVFPDGTGPALLSCMMAGIPLNKCHVLEFAPGEVRLNLQVRDNTLALYEQKRVAEREVYEASLAEGRKELNQLRSNSGGNADNSMEKERSITNAKDRKMEIEQRLIEEEAQRRQEERKQQAMEVERIRRERAEAIEAEKQRRRQEAQQKRQEEMEAVAKEKELRRQKEQMMRAESTAKRNQEKAESTERPVASASSESTGVGMTEVVFGTLAAGAIGVLALNSDGEEERALTNDGETTSISSLSSANATANSVEVFEVEDEMELSRSVDITKIEANGALINATISESSVSSLDETATNEITKAQRRLESQFTNTFVENKSDSNPDSDEGGKKSAIDDAPSDTGIKPADLEKALSPESSSLYTKSLKKVNGDRSANFIPNSPKSPYEEQQGVLDDAEWELLDDGSDDWLIALTQIMETNDDNDEEPKTET